MDNVFANTHPADAPPAEVALALESGIPSPVAEVFGIFAFPGYASVKCEGDLSSFKDDWMSMGSFEESVSGDHDRIKNDLLEMKVGEGFGSLVVKTPEFLVEWTSSESEIFMELYNALVSSFGVK